MSQPTRLADALGALGAPSALSRWFDARLNDAAEGFAALSERVRPHRRVLFVEQENGALISPLGSGRLAGGKLAFAGAAPSLRGAEVEFRLSPERCVFRELELPARAGEFLEGVVRAQIDRLTPWRAGEAAFGWSAPRAIGPDRILVTLAATRRDSIAGLLEVGADGIVVSTVRAPGAPPLAILTARAGATVRQGRWRFALSAALAFAALCGVAALAADWTLGASLSEAKETLTASLDQRRAAMLRRLRANDDPAAQALNARKGASPSAVIVLDALSRAIPDDAYLQELRFKGDSVEISGLAVDPAGLIRQIEQSPLFSRATFTAPTTRSADERESFRIEAHVAPLFVVKP